VGVRRISEEITCREMIDPSINSGQRPQLEKAGWYLRGHSKVKIEIPVDGFLAFRVKALQLNPLRDYKDLVARQCGSYATQHNYNADQIRFLRAVQSVFLQKRHLETADTSTSSVQRLYEPPLDIFGADAVERWFTEKEVEEVVKFANRMAV